VIMTLGFVIEDGQNTAAEVAKDMLEEIAIGVDQKRFLGAEPFSPVAGKERGEEAALYSEGLSGGCEVAFADLEADLRAEVAALRVELAGAADSACW
jgi:hypothetical protein